MRKKENPHSFGTFWGLIGTPERSSVEAVVGAIFDEPGLLIGLNAKQLKNIGREYGQVSVQLYDEDSTPVEVFNSIGEYSKGNLICVSRGIAEKMELRLGDVIKVHRVFDEQGKIRYKCENQNDNPFGRSWGVIEQPAEGIIAAVDSDGYNSGLLMIGLSAMQISNLGINRESARGVRTYGDLLVEYNGHTKDAQIYNASGVEGIGGCGVRVSSALAEELGLKLEDKVRLFR
jgi:hypothetical protein